MFVKTKLLNFLSRLIAKCENGNSCAECEDRQTCPVLTEVLEQTIIEADGEDLTNFYFTAIENFENLYNEKYSGE